MIKPAPGSELDRAVAEAIGWSFRLPDMLGVTSILVSELLPCWYDPDGKESLLGPPGYSTDLNAAFAAAEKVGLFDRLRTKAMLYQVYRDETWCVHWRHPGEQSTFGATPALAICAAILKAQS